MERAGSLLQGVDECAAHGWLVLDRAVFAASAADREKCAVSALAIARRFGDTDLEFDALALLGECYVATGRVAEGMRLLDEVMAAATGGEVTSHGAIGEICCRLLSACEHATDVRRAEQWMDLIQRSVAWTDFVVPTCRSHYGGILVALGRWAEAETRAARRDRDVQARLPRRQLPAAHAAGRPARAAGPLRGGRAPDGGGGLAPGGAPGHRHDRAGARRPRPRRGARPAVHGGRGPGGSGLRSGARAADRDPAGARRAERRRAHARAPPGACRRTRATIW